MAKGVSVDIADGVATLAFSDAQTRGEALAKLLDLGGPNAVRKDTGGTQATYIVSEELATEAGLVDKRRRASSKAKLS